MNDLYDYVRLAFWAVFAGLGVEALIKIGRAAAYALRYGADL